jgi:hypothetical protein
VINIINNRIERMRRCSRRGRRAMRATTPQQDLLRGIWRENPVLVQLLGLCPALAVTNTVANGLAMSIATFFVLLGSSIFVSLLRKPLPGEVRISSYILIIATFVTLVDLLLAAIVPDIHKALGAFIALIVVNCMILSRQEAFAARRTVGRSILDAGARHRLHHRHGPAERHPRGARQRHVPRRAAVRAALRAVDHHDPAARRLLHAGRADAGAGVVDAARRAPAAAA